MDNHEGEIPLEQDVRLKTLLQIKRTHKLSVPQEIVLYYMERVYPDPAGMTRDEKAIYEEIRSYLEQLISA